jgi:hypothetical protein
MHTEDSRQGYSGFGAALKLQWRAVSDCDRLTFRIAAWRAPGRSLVSGNVNPKDCMTTCAVLAASSSPRMPVDCHALVARRP